MLEREHEFYMESNVMHKFKRIKFNVSNEDNKFSFIVSGNLWVGVNASMESKGKYVCLEKIY